MMKHLTDAGNFFCRRTLRTAARFVLFYIAALPSAVLYAQQQESTEQMSRLDNGQIKLGVDLSIGGAITYLADSKTGDNLINSYDWGRQVQMSFYLGPNPFIPAGKKIDPAWQSLGWNPIQSGDCFGNRSRVISHTNDGKVIYVKCIPMIWPLDNVPGECTFECTFQLDGRTVKATSRLNNNRTEKTWYDDRTQELPAVYTNGPYHKLMTYTGDKPFTHDALAEIAKRQHGPGEFPWVYWTATENWAALVNEQNYGLGVWNEGAYSFVGGFAGGQPGKGGPKDNPTGYIAPMKKEIIDSNIQYEFRYVLIIDTLDNIRKYVYEHAAKNPLPAYDFSKDRQSWVCRNVKDAGWPIQGCLDIRTGGSEAQLVGPETFWQARPVHKLLITAAAKKNETPKTYQAQVFWKTAARNDFTEENSLAFSITADETFSTYTLDIGKQPGYQGAITGLRLDPFHTAVGDGWVRIRAIEIK
jgi:hypothetical protein